MTNGPIQRGPSHTMIDRDEARRKKLAKKPTKSPFQLEEEQRARQKARDARGPSTPKKKKKESTTYRDYRGTRGAIKDAEEGKK